MNACLSGVKTGKEEKTLGQTDRVALITKSNKKKQAHCTVRAECSRHAFFHVRCLGCVLLSARLKEIPAVGLITCLVLLMALERKTAKLLVPLAIKVEVLDRDT